MNLTTTTADQGPQKPPLPFNSEAQSYMAELGSRAKEVRGDVLALLQGVDSDESAAAAMDKAESAIQEGSMSKEELGEMVDELDAQAQVHVVTSDKADGLLPQNYVQASGVNEYEIDDMRRGVGDYEGQHYTEGQLNATYEAPDKAA